jgi:hypothetical protein
LWASDNPVNPVTTPNHDTKGNLRLLRYVGKYTGISYTQTSTGEATQTTAPRFEELNIAALHSYLYTGEPVEIECYAKLTAKKLKELHDQTLFKTGIALIDRLTGEVISAGRLLEASQVDGMVYKLKLRRI